MKYVLEDGRHLLVPENDYEALVLPQMVDAIRENMQRRSYPIPPGYRMLVPGELIQPTDEYWNDTGFTSVFPMAWHDQLADPKVHPCLIRKIPVPFPESLLAADPDQFCYGCGVRFPDGRAPGIFCTANGTTAYFHSEACKLEWWHRQDRAAPKNNCEGCGKDMTNTVNYGMPEHMACTPFCADSLKNQDVPVQNMMTDEEIATNRARLHELSTDTERRDDQIRPNYYKQGGIEVITIIKVFKLGFNLGNVLKYILRAGLKTTNRVDDLKKANTYLQFELQEAKEKENL